MRGSNLPRSRLVGLSVLLAVGVLSLPRLAETASAASNRSPTTTTITSTTSRPGVGQPIEIHVRVVAETGAGYPYPPNNPFGSVTVSDGTHTCTARLSGSGTVTTGHCAITEDAPDTYTFNATYHGNYGDDQGSSTTTGTPVTVKATSTTVLALSVTTVTYGDEQVETLTVTVSSHFAGTPTGTVTIKASQKKLCVITLSEEDSCTLAATQLNTGTHDVAAHYSGTTEFKASTSSTETLTVTT
jgi:Bacterial Ig-like domain (group 3)